MSTEERMYEINRRMAEIRTILILLDELEEKEALAREEDLENLTEGWTKELKEAYDLRPELEAELEELEKEMASLYKLNLS